MNEDNFVEVYTAADLFEAERLRKLLEDEGLRATVVGDESQQVADATLNGGVASPRILVHEQDQEEAAELIEEWLAEIAAGADVNAADESDEEEEAPAEIEGISTLGKLLILFGLGCILAGASFGWSNHQLAESFVGETEAVRVAVLPFAQDRPPNEADALRSFVGYYEYRANGEKYEVLLPGLWSAADAAATLPVHFNPRNPREHWLGTLPSPWLPLVFGSFFGSLLMFIVYRLN